jgi:hypothetical protein
MPFPIIAVILVAGGGLFAARKVKDTFGDQPPSVKGYCTHCGETGSHDFHASGLTWGKAGPAGILFGALGLGILSVGARNVYKCRACTQLTLPCRVPRCQGMAKSGSVYDDEFCGECRSANDAGAANRRAERSAAERNMMAEVLRQQAERLRAAEDAVRRARAERHVDKDLIARLLKYIDALKGDMTLTTLALTGPVMEAAT